MRTLYLECNMGAAGDMLSAALLELHPEPETVIEKLNHLGLKDVTVKAEPAVKCGITGTHMTVAVHGEEEESMDVHSHGHGHNDEQNHGHECSHEHEHPHGDEYEQSEEHDHPYEHDHDHKHGHSHGYDHDYDYSHKHEHDHLYEYDHDHKHGHSHDHDHSHAHDHSHLYEYEHDHNHDRAHHHAGMDEITHIISHMNVSDRVKADVTKVYQLIAEAESKAHGRPVSEIHFHEVGTLDAIADITAVCLLIEELAPEQILASPVHVGSGHVHCAHGILPVPAPATAHILKGVPIYGGGVKGELCTPTGAALLKHFVTGFGEMPMMQVEAIGYGMGKKDFAMANCVRACLGETADTTDEAVELSCNLDDMTGEAIGFAEELLLEKGALDVYTIPIGMKKSRPGIMLSCLCRPEDAEVMRSILLKHTTTLGVRQKSYRRFTLERRVETVETKYGAVRVKLSQGAGIQKAKPEYEDVAKAAKKHQVTLAEVTREAFNDR